LSRLAEYPDLTAVRLLAEIKVAGYLGGYSQARGTYAVFALDLLRSRSCGSRRRQAIKVKSTSRTSA